MKVSTIIFTIILGLALTGCEDSTYESARKQRSAQVYKACIDSGGIPIPAWYDDALLSDCKYPPSVSK